MDAIPNTQPEQQPKAIGVQNIGPPAVEEAVRRPKLLAPLWHTAIILIILLAPSSFWRPLGRLSSTVDRGGLRIPAYVWLLAFQWSIFLILLAGPMLRKIRIRDMIGDRWHSWQDFYRDMKLAINVMVFNILVAVLAALVLPTGHYAPDPMIPRKMAPLLGFIPIACTAGFTEEIMCRGYLQRQFYALTGRPAVALVLQAAVFSLAHGYDQSIAGFAARFSAGLTFGAIAISRRSLLPGILGHACQDCLAGALAMMFAM